MPMKLGMRLRWTLAVSAALASLAAAPSTAAGSTPTTAADRPARPVAPVGRAPVPGTDCTVFPADNVWNLNVSRLPVHRKSATWKRAMHAGSTRLHPDFGP